MLAKPISALMTSSGCNDYESKIMLRLDGTADLIGDEDKIRRWRCGRIILRAGKLVEIQRRLIGGGVSVAEVWWHGKYGRADDDFCWIDYHQSLGSTAFLTLDYIRAGKKAGYGSFSGACHMLDEVARIRGAAAIVTHVSNGHISDRLLRRMGWQRHLDGWKGRHWIRRFYDGYPPSTIDRYVDSMQSSMRTPLSRTGNTCISG